MLELAVSLFALATPARDFGSRVSGLVIRKVKKEILNNEGYSMLLLSFLFCHVLRDSTPFLLGLSVGHNLLFLVILPSLAKLLRSICSSDRKHRSCPPSRIRGSRVPGLNLNRGRWGYLGYEKFGIKSHKFFMFGFKQNVSTLCGSTE